VAPAAPHHHARKLLAVLSDDGAGEPIAPARDATTVNLALLARDRSARCGVEARAGAVWIAG
jgi:hypothetical protein